MSPETYKSADFLLLYLCPWGVHHWSLYHEATNVPLILRAPCMYSYTMSAAVRILGFKQSLHNFGSTILTRGFFEYPLGATWCCLNNVYWIFKWVNCSYYYIFTHTIDEKISWTGNHWNIWVFLTLSVAIGCQTTDDNNMRWHCTLISTNSIHIPLYTVICSKKLVF